MVSRVFSYCGQQPAAVSAEQRANCLVSFISYFSMALLLTAGLGILGFSRQARGQDQFVHYFGAGTAGAGLLGGAAVDSVGDFWLIGFGPSQRIRHVEFDGVSWSGIDSVVSAELALFYRADDLPAGNANSDWGGQIGGSAGSLLLNPAPLSIDVPTGAGGVQTIVYPAGSLAFVADNVGVPIDTTSTSRPDVAKKLFRYDLRTVLDPTSVEPDFNTAMPFAGGPTIGSFGTADWNDVFQPVVSEQDLRNQSGSNGSDSFGKQFGWSSDGQWIYAIDSSVGQGGIYKIDPTRFANDPGGITRILDDGDSNSATNEASIRSEPAIVPTTLIDYSAANPAVGDQIVVEGSFNSGNSGGVNVFVDEGNPTLSPSTVLFTEADYRAFADYYPESRPRYISIANDSSGNLYMHEQQTDVLFRYDTQGRFVKIASERELNLFQQTQSGSFGNDRMSNLTVRTSNEPGFAVTELIYTDRSLNTPVGILAFEPGDFDRDNDLDSTDLSLFSAALGTRNSKAIDANALYDLNGNEQAFRDVNNEGDPVIRHTTNEEVVVDWKDVKILQQFALFPNGDTNFDYQLDFTDLDTMAVNYYTLPGQNAETWIDGDFASIDPEYIFDAADANLVNEVDINVIVDAWLNDLGLMAPSEVDLTTRYSGQFLTDLLAAFNSASGLTGDYNNDGLVDGDDYQIWSSTYGASGSGLAADGNGDGVVDAADYALWRDNVSPTTGDYNGDGTVNNGDYQLWIATFGAAGGGLAADGNGDGIVDAADYALWRDNVNPHLTAGDYNGDGLVDAADYTLWRNMNGQVGSSLAADGDVDGDVDLDDYFVWLNGYGSTIPSFASIVHTSVSVPEPAGLILLGLAAQIVGMLRSTRK